MFQNHKAAYITI